MGKEVAVYTLYSYRVRDWTTTTKSNPDTGNYAEQKEEEEEEEEEEKRERERENSNSKTLFHEDCCLSLVKNLSNN